MVQAKMLRVEIILIQLLVFLIRSCKEARKQFIRMLSLYNSLLSTATCLMPQTAQKESHIFVMILRLMFKSDELKILTLVKATNNAHLSNIKQILKYIILQSCIVSGLWYYDPVMGMHDK